MTKKNKNEKKEKKKKETIARKCKFCGKCIFTEAVKEWCGYELNITNHRGDVDLDETRESEENETFISFTKEPKTASADDVYYRRWCNHNSRRTPQGGCHKVVCNECVTKIECEECCRIEWYCPSHSASVSLCENINCTSQYCQYCWPTVEYWKCGICYFNYCPVCQEDDYTVTSCDTCKERICTVCYNNKLCCQESAIKATTTIPSKVHTLMVEDDNNNNNTTTSRKRIKI